MAVGSMNAGYICSRVFLYLLPPRRAGTEGMGGVKQRERENAPPRLQRSYLLNLNLPLEVVDPWSNAQAGVVLQQQQQHQYPALRTGTWTICNSPLLALARSREREGIFFGSACVRAGGRAGHVHLESGVVCSSL